MMDLEIFACGFDDFQAILIATYPHRATSIRRCAATAACSLDSFARRFTSKPQLTGFSVDGKPILYWPEDGGWWAAEAPAGKTYLYHPFLRWELPEESAL